MSIKERNMIQAALIETLDDEIANLADTNKQEFLRSSGLALLCANDPQRGEMEGEGKTRVDDSGIGDV